MWKQRQRLERCSYEPGTPRLPGATRARQGRASPSAHPGGANPASSCISDFPAPDCPWYFTEAAPGNSGARAYFFFLAGGFQGFPCILSVLKCQDDRSMWV